jgi:hypothetical protein
MVSCIRLPRALVVTVVALAGALALAASAQAQTAPSLEGEAFQQFVPALFHVSGSCDPSGTSTLSFTVDGAALGPYPGTFDARGLRRSGPRSSPRRRSPASPSRPWGS